jgi:hypothetical protein
LHLLLLTARGSEVFDAPSVGSSSNSGAASAVAAAIKQQVQASGLLERLPGLMTAVADSVQALPSALPWLDEDDSTLQRAQLRHSCAGLTASQRTQLLQDTCAKGFLQLSVPLLGTWTTLAYAAPSLARPSVLPALRLSVLALQHGSSCMDLLSAAVMPEQQTINTLSISFLTTGQAASFTMIDLLLAVSYGAIHEAVQNSSSSWDGAYEGNTPVLVCGVFRHALWALLLIAVQPQPPQPSGAPSSDVGTHAGSSTRGIEQGTLEDTAAAWMYACGSHTELPKAQQQLLQLLGCSGRAILYLATRYPELQDTPLRKQRVLRACNDCIYAPLESYMLSGQVSPAAGLAWESMSGQALQAQHLVLLLLLQWVSRMKYGTELHRQLFHRTLMCVSRHLVTLEDYRALIWPPSGCAPRHILQLAQHAGVSTQAAGVLPSPEQLSKLLGYTSTAAQKLLDHSPLSRSSEGRESAGSSNTAAEEDAEQWRQGLVTLNIVVRGLRILTKLGAGGSTAQQVSSQGNENSSRSSSSSSRRGDGSGSGGSYAGSRTVLYAAWRKHTSQFIAALEAWMRVHADRLQGDTQPLFDFAMELLGPELPCRAAAQEAGAGSGEQQRLCGLLFSMRKTSRRHVGKAETWDCLCYATVLSICAEVLHSAASHTTTSSSSSSGSCAAEPSLPWLVLVGQFCMLLAGWMQQMQAASGSLAQASPSTNTAMQGVYDNLSKAVSASLEWLQAGSTSAQLSTAGYMVHPLLQRLPATAAALAEAGTAQWDADSMLRLCQQLQDLGLALTNLPISCACNNPLCSNMSGVSEQQLVMRLSCLCANCRRARYCCRECQRQQWKAGQHKVACRALAAAQQAADTPEPAASQPSG